MIVVGNLGAKAIGSAAHGSITKNVDGTLTYNPPSINGTQQLALHAALGCGMASAGGNDCASGAVSGMVGEFTAEKLDQNTTLSDNTIKELAGLGGGLSAIVTGNAVGLDDQEIADNIFGGQRIGVNAGANNALYFRDKKLRYTDWITTKDVEDFDLNIGVQGNLTHVNGSYGTDGAGLAIDLNPSIGGSAYFSVSPKEERIVGSNTLGFKNFFFSGGPLYTNKGNAGFAGSFGLALPLYPVPVNATINIPLDKLQNSSK